MKLPPTVAAAAAAAGDDDDDYDDDDDSNSNNSFDCLLHFVTDQRIAFALTGGFYQDQMGQVECKHCSVGTYVSVERHPGKSAADCLACPYGKNYGAEFTLLLLKIPAT